MDVAVYKRSFDPEHDVVVIVTGKDVDWIEAVKNEMIQTLDFLIKFDEEGTTYDFRVGFKVKVWITLIV